jgi:hypothetical protein
MTLFDENVKKMRVGNLRHMKRRERYTKFEWKNWWEGKFERVGIHSEKIMLKWILGK